jgi:plasmid stability protein
VILPDELDARLRFEARRRGVSVADLVREALDAKFGQPPGRRQLSFVAIADGDGDNVSERVDEFVSRAIQRRKLS